MTENIRALFVILFLAGGVFLLARKSCARLIGDQTYKLWSGLWLGLTLVAFLVGNFWLYLLVAAYALIFAAKRTPNRIALFFMLMFMIPPGGVFIPGLGLVNYLFTINHVMLMEIILFVPLLFHLRRDPNSVKFGRLSTDKFLMAYLLVMAVLAFRDTSFTGGLRDVFILFVTVFLPYFVISRSLHSVEDFRQAILAFVLASVLLAATAIFEGAKHWLLYRTLVLSLDISWSKFGYLQRADLLRAEATTDQPIVLGYVLAVAIGLMLYLKDHITSRYIRWGGMAMLVGGLAASVSRGPWVGTMLMLVLFLASGPRPVRQLTLLGYGVAGVFAVLLFMPGGQKFIDLLPWIGSVEPGSITYRNRVLDGSLSVIARNPLFGTTDITKFPEMQALLQGQGIIDIVNTYMLIALEFGLIAMALFVAFFVSILWGIYTQLRQLPDKYSEVNRLGRSLFIVIVGILFMIFAVSNISFIPVVFWSMAGLGVAYIQMVRHKREDARKIGVNE